MVKSMTAAAAVPHFHLSDDVRVDGVVALRERLRSSPALAGARLTYLPFFVKAAAIALGRFPTLNSSLAADGAALLQHRRVNVGVAIATPAGLVVPNIKDVGALSVAEVARELARLSAAAAANRLRPEDVAGGTFTVSNIGSVGGTYAAPLVNLPEASALH
jgi:2-oxoisovalerate dehydrogenase E2 component (dihydrolipoyl transacylase)